MSFKHPSGVDVGGATTRDRKTVAAFFDYLAPFSSGYQAMVRTALDEHCRTRDVNLITVYGRAIDEPNPRSKVFNAIYDLIDTPQVDGIIILSTTLAAHCGAQGIARFAHRFRHLPLCSVGVAIPNVPSVVTDNEHGVNAVMEHMLGHHGCRRIAFLSGPARSPEAQARLEVYRIALARHAIAFDPALVTCGEFRMLKSAAAMAELLSRKPDIDAVVAASDLMALGAITALRQGGYRVPDDIPVTGFDDLPASSVENPPLTTVAQPYVIMGRQALDVVLNQIAGRTVSDVTELPAALVVRRSCGCSARARRERSPWQPVRL
jgi:DNA-binding LacI/PurR family transcriptional regulator